MSIFASYPFNNTADYNKTLVDVIAGQAKLQLTPHPGQLFTQDFASSAGFTFNAANTEFVGGVMRQKDQTPANSILGAVYDSITNLNWNKGGAVTATLNGTPTIVGGKLQCHGVHGVRYPANTAGIGAIKFKFTPNYSTVPAVNINLVGLHQAAGTNNRIVLTHSPSGSLRISLNDSAGTAIHNAISIGANPTIVAGTEYEVELNWDNVAGIIRLFWNGALQGTLSPGPWTHSAVAGVLHVGADATVYNTSNASFNDLISFSTVQHTALYTPGYSVPTNIYLADTITLPTFSYPFLATILSLTSLATTEANEPHYSFNGKYWNGSAWVAGTGVYSDANDLGTVNLRLAQLDVTGTTSLAVKISWPAQNVQSSVDLFGMTYVGQKYQAEGYLEPVAALNVQSLVSYLQTATEPANTSVKVIFKIDGVLKYWNGSAWVTSNGTGAQANTAAEVLANIAALSLGSNSTVYVRWVLSSTNILATPLLEEADLEYNFGAIEVDPLTCIVYGYYKDIANQAVAGASVTFELVKNETQEYSEAQNNVIEKKVVVVTDVNGYFSTPLIRTSEYDNGGRYKVSIVKAADSLATSVDANGSALEFNVPDAETKDITDLLPTA